MIAKFRSLSRAAESAPLTGRILFDFNYLRLQTAGRAESSGLGAVAAVSSPALLARPGDAPSSRMEKPVQEQILDLLDRLAHPQAGFGQELRIHDALDRRQHTLGNQSQVYATHRSLADLFFDRPARLVDARPLMIGKHALRGREAGYVVKVRPAITWLEPNALERATKKTQLLEKLYEGE